MRLQDLLDQIKPYVMAWWVQCWEAYGTGALGGGAGGAGGDGGDGGFGDGYPATPTSLTATAISSSRIDLAWSSPGDNTVSFVIERSLDGATFAEIATVPVYQTAYSDTGLAASTRYWYRVKATNG